MNFCRYFCYTVWTWSSHVSSPLLPLHKLLLYTPFCWSLGLSTFRPTFQNSSKIASSFLSPLPVHDLSKRQSPRSHIICHISHIATQCSVLQCISAYQYSDRSSLLIVYAVHVATLCRVSWCAVVLIVFSRDRVSRRPYNCLYYWNKFRSMDTGALVIQLYMPWPGISYRRQYPPDF